MPSKVTSRKTPLPKEKIIQFRISENMYNILCQKAAENRFAGLPNLYARHLLENTLMDVVKNDELLKSLLIKVDEKINTVINNQVINQITSEQHFEFSIGHHQAPPQEYVEDIQIANEARFSLIYNTIMRKAKNDGSVIFNRIADTMRT
jgi:hypothetical protein